MSNQTGWDQIVAYAKMRGLMTYDLGGGNVHIAGIQKNHPCANGRDVIHFVMAAYDENEPTFADGDNLDTISEVINAEFDENGELDNWDNAASFMSARENIDLVAKWCGTEARL